MGRTKVLSKDLSIFQKSFCAAKNPFKLLIELRWRIDDFSTVIKKGTSKHEMFLYLHIMKPTFLLKLSQERVIYCCRKAYDNKNHETIKVFTLREETAL